MSLRVWAWIAGLTAILSLVLPASYTLIVVTRAPVEMWSWGHQLAATFFSVIFTGAIGVLLYSWQTRRTALSRRRELRAAALIAIFDIRELVSNDNLKTVTLPDGSEEKVLLTFLQPTIFEEAMRSGLFGASETLILSRMAAIAQIYNGKTTRFMDHYSAIKSKDDADVEGAVVENLRDQMHAIQDDAREIVAGGDKLMKLWSFKEFKKVIDIAEPNESDEPDPRVEQLLEQNAIRVRPAGYKVGFYEKLWEAEDKIKSDEKEAVEPLFDDLVEEVRNMPEKKVTQEEAKELIESVEEVREAMHTPEQPKSPE